jgi:hypothetical protein
MNDNDIIKSIRVSLDEGFKNLRKPSGAGQYDRAIELSLILGKTLDEIEVLLTKNGYPATNNPYAEDVNG